MSECGCLIEYDCAGDKITYCPLHANAGRLLEAAKNIEKVCMNPGMKDPFSDSWKWFYKLRDAIEAASKEGHEQRKD